MRIINRSDLRTLGINYSPSHLLQLEKAGKFPRRMYLSASKVAWVEAEVLAWLEEMKAKRA